MPWMHGYRWWNCWFGLWRPISIGKCSLFSTDRVYWRVIGLTVVAIGTSLPELATSAVAAFKKNSDIVIGNVIDLMF